MTVSSPSENTEAPARKASGTFAALGSCLLGSLGVVAVGAAVFHLEASGWLSPLGLFLEGLMDGLLAHAWVSIPVAITLMFSLVLAAIDEESDASPVRPFFQRFLAIAPVVSGVVLAITLVAYSFAAGWWSSLLIAGVVAVHAHAEAFVLLSLVLVLTSLCMWCKSESLSAFLAVFGGVFVSLFFWFAAQDGKIVPMTTLVAEAQKAWSAVPVEDRATPESHLAAARSILNRDKSGELNGAELNSTAQGLTVTRTPQYLGCRRRMEDAAHDTAVYTVISVDGAPVVAGKDPCTAFMENPFVVRLAPQ